QHSVVFTSSQPAIPSLFVLGDDAANVGQIARSQTTGDGELNDLVELLGLPDWFQPVQRHGRQCPDRLSAAASLTQNDLSDWLTTRPQPFAGVRQWQVGKLAEVMHAGVVWPEEIVAGDDFAKGAILSNLPLASPELYGNQPNSSKAKWHPRKVRWL